MYGRHWVLLIQCESPFEQLIADSERGQRLASLTRQDTSDRIREPGIESGPLTIDQILESLDTLFQGSEFRFESGPLRLEGLDPVPRYFEPPMVVQFHVEIQDTTKYARSRLTRVIIAVIGKEPRVIACESIRASARATSLKGLAP